VICAYYGLTPAEHDDLPMEQLDALVRVMNEGRDDG
jgi:hypothetical protein